MAATHEVVRTRAGQFAIRSVAAGEVMHPGVGPLVEAEQLYVQQSRLAERLVAAASPLTVFDVGLGAGSNARAAWLTSAAAPRDAARLELISFDNDLGALTLALRAEHAPAFGLDGPVGEAARALLAHGEHEDARTRWRLRLGDLLPMLARETARADVVFWDPFSPRANPALWTVGAFRAVAAVAAPGCVLLTYSASTRTRAALLLAGWAVGVGDAIGDKRHTTAAALEVTDLRRPLDAAFLRRVSLPDAPLPSDAPADAVARIARLSQFAQP